MIPASWVASTCQPHQPACCRYLCVNGDGWQCAKPRRELKALLDQRVMAGTMNATGDNCQGWPLTEAKH